MKVIYSPSHYHFLSFGGFEIQTLATLKACSQIGIEITKVDCWNKEDDFDIIHFWGLGIMHYDNIILAKKMGKIVVVTGLLSYYEDIFSKLKGIVSNVIPSRTWFNKKMGSFIDALVVVNEEQKRVAINYLKFSQSQVHVVPNVVDEIFFIRDTLPVTCSEKFTADNKFILTTGNVSKRKNQLNLAKACVRSNIDLLIIGNLPATEKEYCNELDEFVEKNKSIKWIKGLLPNSKELFEAYRDCFLFALPSYSETQPISVLEAAAMQKPILIGNKAYSRQKYFLNAGLANPDSFVDISEQIGKIIKSPDKFIPKIPEECRAMNVASSYIKIYRLLL